MSEDFFSAVSLVLCLPCFSSMCSIVRCMEICDPMRDSSQGRKERIQPIS